MVCDPLRNNRMGTDEAFLDGDFGVDRQCFRERLLRLGRSGRQLPMTIGLAKGGI